MNWYFLLVLVGWGSMGGDGLSLTDDMKASYWLDLGRADIESALGFKPIQGIAKNVILFIGDGMGLSTITASRIFKGQADGRPGEENFLVFEKFKTTGLLKTYNVDRQVPDSAATASAMYSGVKANYYTMGYDGTVSFNVCRLDVQEKGKVSNIISWAMETGKSTGIVTTTRLSHATPGAAYANSPNRDWECDLAIPEIERNFGCKDITRQLVEDEPGKNINVLLGGGEQTFRTNLSRNESGLCFRGDKKDLIWEWQNNQKEQNRSYRFVKDRLSLLSVEQNIDYLLGTFSPSNMPYDKDRTSEEPSLEEMTNKAIQILQKNNNGFLLIVEGGRIDHAHHNNLAGIAMEEVVAFEASISKALELTNEKDTLIIVTADHSHSFSIVGYPKRGNPITGIGDKTKEGFTYETLAYINGPAYVYHRLNSSQPSVAGDVSSTSNTWKNLTEIPPNRTVPHWAGIWADYESHGGEDVPIYAKGPMAHLFQGVHEQTHIAYVIAYSACIGPYRKDCRKDESTKPKNIGNSSNQNSFLICLVLFLYLTRIIS